MISGMNSVLPLDPLSWAAALSPLALLLVLLVGVKMKTRPAALLAWLLAMAVAALRYGTTLRGIMIANGKGLALALFVVLIIWTAVVLYNVVKHAGAISVISDTLTSVTSNRLLQLLLLAWCFASFIQGVAGFGVPVAVVAPLLVGIGFNPVLAASAALVGHAWSVTFGSMASSYFSLQLVVSLPPAELTYWLGLLFLSPILVCGLSVAHMHGGFRDVGRALPAVLLTSFVMGLTLIVVTRIGAVQLGTLASGAAGVTTITLYSRLSRFGKNADGAETQQVGEPSSRHAMGLFTAAFPYIFLVVVVSLSQIPALKSALAGYRLAFAFPASSTALGFEVAPVTDYAAIRLFAHPAPFLAAAAILGALIYRRKTTFDLSTVRAVARDSYKQCWNATLSIGLMVMMALVMNDSGMTSVLASGVANFSGRFFPLFSPLVGVLGSFMTGSNTNSNVLFGAFQEQVALQLGVSAAILAAAQSVGGSLGSAIAPAKAIIGAATVGIAGQEGAILKNTLLYCLLNAAIVGIIVFLVV